MSVPPKKVCTTSKWYTFAQCGGPTRPRFPWYHLDVPLTLHLQISLAVARYSDCQESLWASEVVPGKSRACRACTLGQSVPLRGGTHFFVRYTLAAPQTADRRSAVWRSARVSRAFRVTIPSELDKQFRELQRCNSSGIVEPLRGGAGVQGLSPSGAVPTVTEPCCERPLGGRSGPPGLLGCTTAGGRLLRGSQGPPALLRCVRSRWSTTPVARCIPVPACIASSVPVSP